MRIGFVGKGGAGKTTISSLFARYCAHTGASVLAIDADINQHLAAALNVPLSHGADIADHGEEIKRYLAGGNPRIAPGEMLKTTPIGEGARLVRLSAEDPLLKKYARCHSPVTLLTTGAFHEADLGSHCYHSKTGCAEVILSHLIDSDDDVVVVDLTAGSDIFASGLCAMFDLTVMVVEPTIRSISVFKQYQEYAQHFQIPLVALGNKVRAPRDEEFILHSLPDCTIGFFPFCEYVTEMDRGVFRAIEELPKEALRVLETLTQRLRATKPNIERRLELGKHFHVKNCLDWANAFYGKDLRDQIDPSITPNDIQFAMKSDQIFLKENRRCP